MLGFTISSLVCCWSSSSSVIPANTFTFNPTVYTLLLVISVLLTPLYLFQVYQLVVDSGSDNWMYAARMIALDDEINIGKTAYCFVINQVLFVTTVFAGKQLKWWKHLLVICLYFLCGMAIMEKGTFIFMIIVAIMVYYQREIVKIRHLAIIGILLILSAFVFTIARSDTMDSLNDSSIFAEFIDTYLLAGPVAYCYMPEETINQWGSNTFAQFYLIANKLDLGDFVVKSRLQDFIDVGSATNTYTVFQPFYLDFGQLGVLIFAIIYGIITGLAYTFHKRGNSFSTIIYGFMVAMLCLQFHQEEIFSSFIRTIQYVFFALLLTLPTRQEEDSKITEKQTANE